MIEGNKVAILGVPMYAGPLAGAVRHVIEICLKEKDGANRCISATGAHGLVTSKKDPVSRKFLRL